MKKIFSMCLAFLLVGGLLTACQSQTAAPAASESKPDSVSTSGSEHLASEQHSAPVAQVSVAKEVVPEAERSDVVAIDMGDDMGRIVIQLLPQYAPETVKNFKELVAKHFYDGLIFHRIIDGFMIQGGDPTGTGMGGAEETIKGEFLDNGVENLLSHRRGVVSMARSQDFNSASSQFFICNADSTFLDRQYAAFGRVLSGMDVVDRIAKLPKNAQDRPDHPPVMKEVSFLSQDEANAAIEAAEAQSPAASETQN